jgi:hypothetical protein
MCLLYISNMSVEHYALLPPEERGSCEACGSIYADRIKIGSDRFACTKHFLLLTAWYPFPKEIAGDLIVRRSSGEKQPGWHAHPDGSGNGKISYFMGAWSVNVKLTTFSGIDLVKTVRLKDLINDNRLVPGELKLPPEVLFDVIKSE